MAARVRGRRPSCPDRTTAALGAGSIAAALVSGRLIARVSAAITLVLFGPQALTQALGALLITHATYRQIYIASAVVAIAIAAWIASQRQHADQAQRRCGSGPSVAAQ